MQKAFLILPLFTFLPTPRAPGAQLTLGELQLRGAKSLPPGTQQLYTLTQ